MIRHLTSQDIPVAFQMSYAAGWNQTCDDWRTLLTLEPGGCFGRECDGRLVATTTLLSHRRDLAWLGMVLTEPTYQRRGFARDLLRVALEFTESGGISTVKLDATNQGRPLYVSLGFEGEQRIERWQRDPAPLDSAIAEPSLGIPDADLDRAAFGADRSRFLQSLGPALRIDHGFAMHRNGSRARYLGPCVARDPATADALIRAIVSAHSSEPWFWDLFPENGSAVDIAHSLGFVPVRQLMRMRRGARICGDDNLIYAIAGFEAG